MVEVYLKIYNTQICENRQQSHIKILLNLIKIIKREPKK
jgi:hypothetical protein